MCLEIQKDAKILIAAEDIVCYKIVKNPNEYHKNYRSYFQLTDIEIGKTYISCLNRVKNSIEEGLHSMGHYYGVSLLRYYLADINSSIVKCIIPKGSSYYVGEFYSNISYASDKLIYVEFCKL